MKNVLLFLFGSSFFCVQAQTYTYQGDGNWDEVANWSPSYPGSTISAADKVTISEGSEVTVFYLTNNGTITNKGSIYTSGPFNNYGTIINDSTFTSRSFFYNNGTLINNFKFQCNSFFENNSHLIDNGKFYHNSFFYGKNKTHENDFTMSSIFSPGSTENLSVGKYIFNDNLIISNGYFGADIRSNTEYDTIVVSGQATLSGSLNVKLLPDYEPTIGRSFTILTASRINGKFDRVSFPLLNNGNVFEIKYTANAVVLHVVQASLGLNDRGEANLNFAKKIVKAYNLQGQEIDWGTFEGIAILMYSDGTRAKVLK